MREPLDVAVDAQPDLDLERTEPGGDGGSVRTLELLAVAGQRQLDRDLGAVRPAQRDRQRDAERARPRVPQCDRGRRPS
ncbi:hypothetical protein [Jiangella mangrovi]|uniref:Uncharacterized protein n=1 Tax=Jiangella mangrovi TaxID=1524084 RepID=A0A7W9GV56_9ACTN|nr:hypothetical protein [Jiangella mangrovi]MBB5790668.1 hypothetical protein [Jiangella mangrovi]